MFTNLDYYHEINEKIKFFKQFYVIHKHRNINFANRRYFEIKIAPNEFHDEEDPAGAAALDGV